MLSEAQIAERKNYVTGSDASVILGVNPYESVIDLWRYKLGLMEKKDISDNPRVKAGNYLESVVMEMFIDATGKKVHKVDDMLVHPVHTWMAGNIDGAVENESAILEIKTTSRADGWGELGSDNVPLHYLCQVAHYLALTGAAKCFVAVLISGWDFRYYTIERNKKLEDILIEKERFFWHENVKKEIAPEPRNIDDVMTLYKNNILEEPLVASPHIIELIEKMKSLRDFRKEMDDEEVEIKNQVALYMKNYQTVVSPFTGNPVLTWKPTKDIEMFDKDKFRKENPELYSKYTSMRDGPRRWLLKYGE